MKDLRVYVKAVEFYRACKTVKCDAHLKDQLMRAASSIPLNVAEGYGKISGADKRRFWKIAFGSIRECQTIVELADATSLVSEIDMIAAMMWKLLESAQ